MDEERVRLNVDDIACEIALLRRSGPRKPILFIHGFGSTKEDFADVIFQRAFDGRDIIAFDAPGCGASTCADLSAVSMPFMAKTLRHLIAHIELTDFHLVGHSMGGLYGLLYASQNSGRLSSFTSIEGNLTPEDCFLSRQILENPAKTDEAFFNAFITRIANQEKYSHRLYALTLEQKVRTQAVAPIFSSIVEQSDNADLLQRFLSLPCPRSFMFGDANRTLSYLPRLREHGVQMAEIENCGHFPMYANAWAMWAQLGDFLNQADAKAAA